MAEGSGFTHWTARVVGVSRNEWARGLRGALRATPFLAQRASRTGPFRDPPTVPDGLNSFAVRGGAAGSPRPLEGRAGGRPQPARRAYGPGRARLRRASGTAPAAPADEGGSPFAGHLLSFRTAMLVDIGGVGHGAPVGGIRGSGGRRPIRQLPSCRRPFEETTSRSSSQAAAKGSGDEAPPRNQLGSTIPMPHRLALRASWEAAPRDLVVGLLGLVDGVALSASPLMINGSRRPLDHLPAIGNDQLCPHP